ncbi:hypothetical protein WN51_00093 [Melipona quadrifasciata]|uniref:Uncharacterized protein n=1 Tax=Melipona quadrifasciata TaxID=166423 RepID=A0A0M9ACQ5_9HYME|nr:hypothetical protein WN51_00093 [Melipona quadrifasciata]
MANVHVLILIKGSVMGTHILQILDGTRRPWVKVTPEINDVICAREPYEWYEFGLLKSNWSILASILYHPRDGTKFEDTNECLDIMVMAGDGDSYRIKCPGVMSQVVLSDLLILAFIKSCVYLELLPVPVSKPPINEIFNQKPEFSYILGCPIKNYGLRDEGYVALVDRYEQTKILRLNVEIVKETSKDSPYFKHLNLKGRNFYNVINKLIFIYEEYSCFVDVKSDALSTVLLFVKFSDDTVIDPEAELEEVDERDRLERRRGNNRQTGNMSVGFRAGYASHGLVSQKQIRLGGEDPETRLGSSRLWSGEANRAFAKEGESPLTISYETPRITNSREDTPNGLLAVRRERLKEREKKGAKERMKRTAVGSAENKETEKMTRRTRPESGCKTNIRTVLRDVQASRSLTRKSRDSNRSRNKIVEIHQCLPLIAAVRLPTAIQSEKRTWKKSDDSGNKVFYSSCILFDLRKHELFTRSVSRPNRATRIHSRLQLTDNYELDAIIIQSSESFDLRAQSLKSADDRYRRIAQWQKTRTSKIKTWRSPGRELNDNFPENSREALEGRKEIKENDTLQSISTLQGKLVFNSNQPLRIMTV